MRGGGWDGGKVQQVADSHVVEGIYKKQNRMKSSEKQQQ